MERGRIWVGCIGGKLGSFKIGGSLVIRRMCWIFWMILGNTMWKISISKPLKNRRIRKRKNKQNCSIS